MPLPVGMLAFFSANVHAMPQRAIVHRFGPPQDVVTLEPYVLPDLQPHEVRVRMLASPINPSDLVTIAGQYRMRIPLPFLPGFEGVGCVEAVGSDVKHLALGERVLPVGSAGMWQLFKTVAGEWCMPVRDDLSDIEAATSFVNPVTAWLMLFAEGRLVPGMRLFINGAGSAIGRILIRMANHIGIAPLISTRRAASLQPAHEGLQVEHHLIEEDNDYECQRQAFLRDMDIVLDCVGGNEGICWKAGLKRGGLYMHYGLLSGQALPLAFWQQRQDVRYIAFHMRRWLHSALPEARCEVFERVMAWVSQGIACTDHWHECAFETLPQQLLHMASGESLKKRILLFK